MLIGSQPEDVPLSGVKERNNFKRSRSKRKWNSPLKRVTRPSEQRAHPSPSWKNITVSNIRAKQQITLHPSQTSPDAEANRRYHRLPTVFPCIPENVQSINTPGV